MRKHLLLIVVICMAVGNLPQLSLAQENLNQIESSLDEREERPLVDGLLGAKPRKPILDAFEAKNMDVRDALEVIAQESGLVFKSDIDIHGYVTITLKNVDVFDALRIILDMNDLAFDEENYGLRIMTAATFESEFGYAFDQNIQAKVVNLNYVSPAQVMKSLSSIRSSSGKIIESDDKTIVLIESPNALNNMLTLIKEIDVPLETRVFLISHPNPEEVVQKVQSLVTKNIGEVSLDSKGQKIIVKDTSKHMLEVEKLIDSLNAAQAALVIEYKILQITLNTEHEKGIDWEAIVANYQRFDFDGFGDQEEKGQKRALSFGTIGPEDFNVLLDALNTVGATSTIADTKMIVDDGKESTILINPKEFPLLRDDVSREEMEELATLFRLGVTPKAKTASEGEFDFVLKPQLTLTDGTVVSNPTYFANPSQPRELMLQAEHDQTIVMGGLFKSIKVESMRKFPLLGDLPLLGFVFRSSDERLVKSEILIFMTVKRISKG
jgi:type II secretory pathway component GspD/PulD (secretin)